MTCRWRREIRFRSITSPSNPIPISMKPNVAGSGVAVVALTTRVSSDKGDGWAKNVYVPGVVKSAGGRFGKMIHVVPDADENTETTQSPAAHTEVGVERGFRSTDSRVDPAKVPVGLTVEDASAPTAIEVSDVTPGIGDVIQENEKVPSSTKVSWYVNDSAQALGAPMATNSNSAAMIHKDFRIF